VTLHGADVVLLKDGKIAKCWSYGNGAELLAQVGALKPPAPPKDAKAPPKPAAPKK
jgi:hypothetical protein